ncbi:MAG: hypothetical protein L6Q81_16565 [Bacteroidia bacterium]|nr:hypothetical protein [Bacteroidia bacterium]
MNPKAIITGLALLLVTASNAQGNFGLGTKIGYEYRSSSFAEAGLLLYHPLEGLFDLPWGFVGANVGYTARVGGSDFVSGPKLGVEFHAVVFSVRSDFTYLTNYKKGSWQFSSEAGLSFVGLIYVMGGYNWTFTSKEFWNATGPRLSIGVNLYKLDEFF